MLTAYDLNLPGLGGRDVPRGGLLEILVAKNGTEIK